MASLLCNPSVAERLRISPDDLRLRVAVSEELPPSVRRELKDLAKSSPLPLKDGLLQTEALLKAEFESKLWNEKRRTLSRYYFLVARLEHSQKFSDEFLRRETVLRQGRHLADDYINELNRLIGRAVYTNEPSIELPLIQKFPMHKAERSDESGLLLLHQFPNPNLAQGRKNLQAMRLQAESDRKKIRQRIKDVTIAERNFLDEVSVIGQALIKMRPQIRRWVSPPGEGLPFSR